MNKQQLVDDLAALKQKIEDIYGPIEPLDTILGEEYVESLNRLSEAEAIDHLLYADDAELSRSHLVLSRRLSTDARRRICLKLITRTSDTARALVIHEMGIAFLGTKHKRISYELASIVQDASEDAAIRNAAYRSLELVNCRLQFRPIRHLGLETELVDYIDWPFVDRCLASLPW